ncbi:MAG: T9SS type A sorting domain-containing protein, partial [Ginsengibacter sp.]
GVNYQLSVGGSPVGSSVSGTGSPINFSVTDAGAYMIVATNATAGCTNIMNGTATVTVNPLPNVYNMKGGGDRCSNGGSISIGLTGSQIGVKYQLVKNGVPSVTILNGTGYPIGLSTNQAGTYTMIATNATSGCTIPMNGSAIVNVNSAPTIFSVTGGGVRCYDAAGITVGLSGSQTGVNYQLQNGGSPIGTPLAGTGSAISFQAVDPGTYTVVATNATTTCTSNMTGSVNVSVNPQLTPSYTKYYASSCHGGDGAIMVTGSGGTSPYLFNVDNGTFSNDNLITGLAAGDHRVEVKDANSCSFVWEGITILTAPLMKVNTVRVKPSSCSGNDGSIAAFPYGGAVDFMAPLQYKLDGAATVPFQLSNTFTGLGPGSYTVTIQDSRGCLADTMLTLNVATGLAFASNSYSTNVSSCGGGSDARISVTITGGQAPYHFSIDGTEVGQSNNPFFAFTNLGVGTHTVTVADVHVSCGVSQDFIISQATAPVAIVNYKGNETCIGKNNGYITLSPTGIGGVPGYMFSKDGGSTYQGSMSFTNLSPGAYSMVVKDSKGCTSDAVSVTINAGTVACPPIAEKDNSNLMTASGLSDRISLNSPLIVQAYPNPFASNFVLNVKGNNREPIGIIVTDVLGRKLFEQKGNANQQYNLGRSLKTGIYLVKVIQGNNVQTIKIVKE